MGGILSSLHTSTTGLHAHQLMVDVTGNNIANASDEFYTRQRVIVHPEAPLYFPECRTKRILCLFIDKILCKIHFIIPSHLYFLCILQENLQ